MSQPEMTREELAKALEARCERLEHNRGFPLNYSNDEYDIDMAVIDALRAPSPALENGPAGLADANSNSPAEPVATGDVVREALRRLITSAREVSRYGAQTGPQWPTLTRALIDAESALSPSTSAATGEPVRCLATGNPIGTDTWQAGYSCPCANCAALSASPAPAEKGEASCHEMFAEATRLAGEIGYMVVPDPIHADGEVHAPEFVLAMQPSLRALGFHAVPIEPKAPAPSAGAVDTSSLRLLIHDKERHEIVPMYVGRLADLLEALTPSAAPAKGER